MRDFPHGLKPNLYAGFCGTADDQPSDEDLSPGTPKAVPFQSGIDTSSSRPMPAQYLSVVLLAGVAELVVDAEDRACALR